MPQPYEINTWIVMLQDARATVFANGNPGGMFTRIVQIAGVATESDLERRVVEYLEEAWRSGRFDRWMLVAPARLIERLTAAVSPELSGRLAGARAADLASVPPEEMRLHLPEGACL